MSDDIDNMERGEDMKVFLSKKTGLIAVAAVAVVAVALVVILALGGGKRSQGDEQLVADAGSQAVESTEESSQGEVSEKSSEKVESSEETGSSEKIKIELIEFSEETESSEESVETSEETEPAVSAEEKFYQENGEILRIVDVNTSEDVPTEEEVMTLLSARGFADFPITFDYGMDGAYVGEEEIAGDAATKHPMYQTFFISENQELWTIFVINGAVIANPVSYNLESTRTAQLLISESQEITSYDSNANKYYITIPKESAVIVRTVDKIDAETLNQLTCEAIDRL